MLIDRKKIPDKIYYSISEVSKYTGVEPHVLRYWETKFSKLKPRRVGGNQRKYTKNDLELIFVIMELLYDEGFTLDGAEKKLKDGYAKKNSQNSSSPKAAAPVKPVAPAKPKAPPVVVSETKVLKQIKNELLDIMKLFPSK